MAENKQWIMVHAWNDVEGGTGICIGSALLFEDAAECAKLIVDDWQTNFVEVFDEKPLDIAAVTKRISDLQIGETALWRNIRDTVEENQFHWKVFRVK